jgi:ketosteroid isomerase-like protein
MQLRPVLRRRRQRVPDDYAEGDVVVVEHRLSATLPNGRPYVNDYCFVYEVRDGKVLRIREYMDTRGGWAQVFGEGEPVQLIEFTSG